MLHLLLADSLLLHPLRGLGYQFFSGIGSSISEWATVIVGVGVYLHARNCHAHRCLRVSWHRDDNEHPVCKVHSADHPKQAGRLARAITRLRGEHNGYRPVHSLFKHHKHHDGVKVKASY